MSPHKVTYGSGTADDPGFSRPHRWTSDYEARRDEQVEPPALVVQVGTTLVPTALSRRSRRDAEGARRLMLLGTPTKLETRHPGTVWSAWQARDPKNPVVATTDPRLKRLARQRFAGTSQRN